MPNLTARRILLGISGGIAAYKAAELCRILRRDGADVRVVMTERAMAFITPLSLQALSGQPVRSELMDPAGEAGMGHIELARWADLVLVAPASADCIARLSQGRADDLLSALCLATAAPLALAPAMNQGMWRHPATQRNCAQLAERGATLLGPGHGEQACGDDGPGRMLEPPEIAVAVAAMFRRRLLEGVRAVVTAGPSWEPLDPVRYLGNRSSGRMGFAMAAALRDAGAEVCLVAGPVALATPERLRRIDVESAEEMLQAVRSQLPGCQLFVAAAAVADFRPERAAKHKLRRADGPPTLSLEPTPDVLAAAAAHCPPPFLVGFAAETGAVADSGRRKLVAKKLDMVIANDVSRPGLGFDSEENEVVIVDRDGERALPRAAKTQLAAAIVRIIAERWPTAAKDGGEEA